MLYTSPHPEIFKPNLVRPIIAPRCKMVYFARICTFSGEYVDWSIQEEEIRPNHKYSCVKVLSSKCIAKELRKFFLDMNTLNGVMKFYNEKTWTRRRIFIQSWMHDFSIIQIISFLPTKIIFDPFNILKYSGLIKI